MTPDLHHLLREHWGYTEFRPKQEAIVRAILEGRDAAVVMPTGGGKSLCYQLPAVATGRTCVVVSPLIALMQDQAASMHEIGVEAGFLNSTLRGRELQDVMTRAQRGEFRLLYISPERIVRPDLLAWLERVPVGFFAIDEAHCISEWGHEFRPEYRQLSLLRERFPQVPIAAFTASATRVVRHDILAQLHLRDPACFVMSFHRPNLRYIVRECASGEQDGLLTAALEQYEEGNLILYAPTIRDVEALSARLSARGLAVVPYHGKMDAAARSRNQELWMSGEKRVLVGTIAFGLGINKPDVRAVVHLSLPKSLEQYYQEAGRAGRDGEPADCVLLWQKRDLGLLAHFIQQTQDAGERERCWQRYHVMKRFVEESGCRHRRICLHFGETPPWSACGACDQCGVALDWMAEMEAAEAAAGAAGRAGSGPGPRSTTRPPKGTVAKADLTGIDPELREALRQWRRELAKSQGVPPFVVLHDTTLNALCRQRPRTRAQLLEVAGIGERRAERFGADILRVIAAHE